MEYNMAVRSLSSTLKTLAVCDALAASAKPMRLAEVARRTGDQRATVYQRLRTLVDAGFVEQTAEGAFRLTLRFHFYAAKALEQAGLGERSIEFLRRVVTDSGETATISVLEGDSVVIANRIEAQRMLRADLRVGGRMSLHGSATGAVAVAHASPAMLRDWATRGIKVPDPTELAAVRERGLALFAPSDPELISAVAAPVVDSGGKCVAILAISGPTPRFDHARCAPIAVAAGRELSALFAGAPG
jgi:DNA-binding IclR family transcriptional regulator